VVGVGVDRTGPSPRRLLVLITVTALVLMTLDARDAPGVDAVRGVAGVVLSPIRGVVGRRCDRAPDRAPAQGGPAARGADAGGGLGPQGHQHGGGHGGQPRQAARFRARPRAAETGRG